MNKSSYVVKLGCELEWSATRFDGRAPRVSERFVIFSSWELFTTPSFMLIRKATRADFDFIVRGQKEVAERFERREYFEGKYKGKIYEGIREGRIFVVEDEEKGARLGFAEYLFSPPFTCLTGYLWIDWVYVVPRARGKGVGHALYAYLAKLARRKKLKGLACDVFVVNPRSQEFHEKQGFKKTIYIYQKEF